MRTRQRKKQNLFKKPLERKKMNEMSHKRLVFGCAGGRCVGKSSVYLILTQQLIQHPQPHQLQGKTLSSFLTKIPKWGKGRGALSVCVYKEHTDGLLTFTVINNVVAQLEKKPQVKGRGFPDAQTGAEIREATGRVGLKQ